MANLIGGALPALVTLVTLPIIVRSLGMVDYGVLVVVSAIVGYLSIIDVNLTAGAVKYVAEFRALGDSTRESETIVLAAITYLLLGFAGAIGIYFAADALATRFFEISSDRQIVAIQAIRIAAVGFFFGQLQQFLNSLPQSIQRYDLTARFEVLFGVLVPVISVVWLLLGGGLVEMIILRVISTASHVVVLVFVCRQLFPEFRFGLPSGELSRTVLSFSGFAYLSKMAAVTYAHADKLVIGAFLGMEAVSAYAVPATIVNRALGLTYRLSSVMFPESSRLAARGDIGALKLVYFALSKYVFFLNGCIVALVVLLGREILHYWVGPEIAKAGHVVLILVSLGLLIDSLTNVPSLVNDGLGHSRVSGGFAVSRALIGLGVTWWLAQEAGITGVAAGQLIVSAGMTMAFLAFVHGRSVPFKFSEFMRSTVARPVVLLVLVIGGGIALRPTALLPPGELLATIFLAGTAMVVGGWVFVIDTRHRIAIVERLRKSGLG